MNERTKYAKALVAEETAYYRRFPSGNIQAERTDRAAEHRAAYEAAEAARIAYVVTRPTDMHTHMLHFACDEALSPADDDVPWPAEFIYPDGITNAGLIDAEAFIAKHQPNHPNLNFEACTDETTIEGTHDDCMALYRECPYLGEPFQIEPEMLGCLNWLDAHKILGH